MLAYLLFLFGGRGRPPLAPGLAGRYLRWLSRAPFQLGGGALVALALIGGLSALDRFPGAFLPSAVTIWRVLDGPAPPESIALPTSIALLAGGLAGAAIDRWRRRRGKREWMLGDIRLIQPREWRDYPLATLVAAVAGIVEEAYFRLALPLVLTLLTGSSSAAFAISLGLFAAAHRYQGWSGMLGSALMGAVLTMLYLLTGALWLAVLIHAFVNLNALVLRPALARAQLFNR